MGSFPRDRRSQWRLQVLKEDSPGDSHSPLALVGPWGRFPLGRALSVALYRSPGETPLGTGDPSGTCRSSREISLRAGTFDDACTSPRKIPLTGSFHMDKLLYSGTYTFLILFAK
jgi:hypothetical protein